MPVNYSHHNIPYLNVVGFPREMRGTGAPRSTVFGAIGQTKQDPYQKSLGGLIHKTTVHHDKIPKVSESAASVHKNTERHIIGPRSKTPMPGDHYSQVPYPGAYQSHLGVRV